MTEEATLKYYVYYLPTHTFSHFLSALGVALEHSVWSELPSVGRENVMSKYRIPTEDTENVGRPSWDKRL